MKVNLLEFKNIIKQIIKEEIEYNNNYVFDKSRLDDLIKNARKYNEKDFIEDYIYYNDINLGKIYGNIKKGDEIIIARIARDSNGKNIYKNGKQLYIHYKTVIANKDYDSNHWLFILDNTKELQDEAIKIYQENKNIKKTQFNKNEKTIKGYHASPNKFKQFKYDENKTSGQFGADSGFFFFKDIKYAKYYASIIKENKGNAFIYECNTKTNTNILI